MGTTGKIDFKCELLTACMVTSIVIKVHCTEKKHRKREREREREKERERERQTEGEITIYQLWCAVTVSKQKLCQ